MRKVFFSFHFENDIFRVSRVRNSWVIQGIDAAGFIDSADWESVRNSGEQAIKNWINRQLDGTSVTVVLIGQATSEREYVKYEILESYKRGNGMLGIYIDQMKDISGYTSSRGNNPFGNYYITQNGRNVYFSELYPTYDWVSQDGYNNMGGWIESAATKAGR